MSRFRALGPAERVVASVFLVWAVLGLGHTGMAMVRREVLALRQSPAAARTLGLPDEDLAPLVARVRSTLQAAGDPRSRLVVVLPAETDTLAVIYLRYQLAHLEYPVRVAVLRNAPGAGIPPRVPPGATFVLVPGDRSLPFGVARPGDPLRR